MTCRASYLVDLFPVFNMILVSTAVHGDSRGRWASTSESPSPHVSCAERNIFWIRQIQRPTNAVINKEKDIIVYFDFPYLLQS